MMNSFEYMTSLQYQNKHLKERIEKYQSGEKYVQLQKAHEKELRKCHVRIRDLEKELADAHKQIRLNTAHWMEVIDDVIREKERELKKKDTEIRKLQKKLNDMVRQRDEALDKKRDALKELYEVKIDLQEEQDKNAGLRATMKKDFTNSSNPSSCDPNHPKIPNSRRKTGRHRGGQPGHIHHPRKNQNPDRVVQIPPKKEHLDISKFKPTGKTISKQIIGLKIILDVTEYQTPEFRNMRTGQRVHAEFPEALKDEVTYDGSVKAAAWLLNTGCNVSIKNTKRVFSEFTEGKLNLSTGMISNLQKEFSRKSEEERKIAFKELMTSPTMHVDFTFGRCDGKTSTILICANDNTCLYMLQPKKGDEGVKGSPLEFYGGIVISDHEAAFLHYGSKHQECLSHIYRYAQGSLDNEPGKTWAGDMQIWIQDGTHLRNETLRETGVYDPKEVDGLLKRYDRIMAKAKEEYEEEPPNHYYRDGYNLFKRMSEKKEDYVLFLHDITVDPTNNRAEQLARQYKRKNHQVITFRSTTGNSYYCDGLTQIQNLRQSGGNLYKEITAIFNRP